MSETVSYRGGYPMFFLDKVEEAIRCADGERRTLFFVISIKNLPMIISGYGHETCEAAIKELKNSIGGVLDNMKLDYTCARLQKEQVAFIVTLPDDCTAKDIMDEIRDYTRAFNYMSDYGAVHLLLSTYDTIIDCSAANADDVINQSYLSRSILSPPTDFLNDPASSRKEMNMVHHIHDSLSCGKFCMAFQPIIEAKTGNVARYEALLRVKGKDGELTTAGPLIPLAERMGLIDIIDEMVLEMVTEELIASPELKLSFNVSNLTANSPQWLQRFTQIAMNHPDVIKRMMVEITETAVHLDLRRTAYFVATLQSHGASVALDDFGSGYTSFRQLKSLSMDIVKIDGVFVRDLVENNDNRLFIKTMLDFTKGFGLETVAEFVENGETAKILMDLGVDYMQGYYFGFPDVKYIS